MTAAAPGTEVGLYVDLVRTVDVGDVIETRSSRRYLVVASRRQERGKHAGRHHLRAVVLDETATIGDAFVHRIRWYVRSGGSAKAGSIGVARR